MWGEEPPKFGRFCNVPGCDAEVKASGKQGGYCSGKVAHWNPATASWTKPRCECGCSSIETPTNPISHSQWCPVKTWQES